LIKTCDALSFSPPKLKTIEEQILLLSEKNEISEINFKIVVDKNNFAVFPIKSSYPTHEMYLRGVSCALLFEEREKPDIKAFQSELREKSNEQISRQDVFESVLVNRDGRITEGSRSNLFFIGNDAIYTAPDALVLGGITRLKVLEICKELELEVKFQAISTDQLKHIKAAFICGTSPGVLPIRTIDDSVFDPQNALLLKIHQLYHARFLNLVY
jgi:branched-chain amino acid aminotransferase